MHNHPGSCGPQLESPQEAQFPTWAVTPPLLRRGSRRAPLGGVKLRGWRTVCLRLAPLNHAFHFS
jgi:hypothetical protein